MVIVMGRHEPRSYKTAQLIHKYFVCSNCCTDRPFPFSLPHLGLPDSLRQNNIEIKPVNNPIMASKCSNEESIDSGNFIVILF
jgi:hypothetical protein